jgi:hypothetical protein
VHTPPGAVIGHDGFSPQCQFCCTEVIKLAAILAVPDPLASETGQGDWWVILEEHTGLWWGPRSGGYTDLLRAGLYTEADAKRIAKNPSRRDRAFRLADKLRDVAKLQHPSERVIALLSAPLASSSEPQVTFSTTTVDGPSTAAPGMPTIGGSSVPVRASGRHTEQCIAIALLLGRAGFPEDAPIEVAVQQLIAERAAVRASGEPQKQWLRLRAHKLFNDCKGPTHDCVDWKALHDALTEAFDRGASASPSDDGARQPQAGEWSDAYIGRLVDQSQHISRMLSEAGVGSGTLVEGVRALINRPPMCETHGDPLVCLACEADESVRPEWRRDLEPLKALARTHRGPQRDPFAEQLSAAVFTLITEIDRLHAAASDDGARQPETSNTEAYMNDQQWLSLCNSGDVSDYGASLTILPDSLGRPLAQRIKLLMERADREAHLAVLLREKLHEVAGAEIASSVNV